PVARQPGRVEQRVRIGERGTSEAARCAVINVVAAIGDGSGERSSRERYTVTAIAPRTAIGQDTVDHHGRADADDGAALGAGAVAGEGAVGHVQRAVADDGAAAACGGAVAGARAAGRVQGGPGDG